MSRIRYVVWRSGTFLNRWKTLQKLIQISYSDVNFPLRALANNKNKNMHQLKFITWLKYHWDHTKSISNGMDLMGNLRIIYGGKITHTKESIVWSELHWEKDKYFYILNFIKRSLILIISVGMQYRLVLCPALPIRWTCYKTRYWHTASLFTIIFLIIVVLACLIWESSLIHFCITTLPQQ